MFLSSFHLPAVPALPVPFAGSYQQKNAQDQQNDNSHHYGDQGLIYLHGVRCNIGVTIQIGDPVSADQQPVGIDAVGRAGKQSTVILALVNLQFRQIRRLYDPDLIHLVGDRTVQNGHRPDIPDSQLVQICKKPG